MEGTRVFVGKIPFDKDAPFKKEDLLALFADCGKIVESEVVERSRSRPSTATAFITFETAAGAQAAVNKKPKFMETDLEVEIARPRRVPGAKRELTPEELAAIPNSVLVGNLPFAATEEEVRGEFQQYGTIKNIKLALYRNGKPRGYGYVEFSNPEEANAALAHKDKTLGERPLRVALRKLPSERPPRQPREKPAPKQHEPKVAKEGEAPAEGKRRKNRRRTPKRSEHDDKTLYVGNVPTDAAPETLHEAFKLFGTILKIELATVEDKPKYGYIHFENKVDVDKAVAAAGSIQIEDKVLVVELPRKQRERKPREQAAAAAPGAASTGPAKRKRRTRRPPVAAPSIPLDERTVFVGNLPAETKPEMVYEVLKAHGKITDIEMAQVVKSPYCYVHYEKKEEAEKAVAAAKAGPMQIGDKIVRMAIARQPTARSPTQPKPAGSADAPTESRRRSRAPKLPVGEVDEKSVYVSRLPSDATPEIVRDALRTFGTVINVQLREKRRYGYVQFDKKEEADKAIAASDTVKLGEKTIQMSVAIVRTPAVEAAPNTEVHIGNLPLALDAKAAEEEVRKLLADVGTLKSIAAPIGRNGKFRGYALVQFETVEQATAARAKTDTEIGGRKIKVKFSRPTKTEA